MQTECCNTDYNHVWQEKIYALQDLHCIKYECYSEISIQKYSRCPSGGLWFLDVPLYTHTEDGSID
jgi:hypothetical protein